MSLLGNELLQGEQVYLTSLTLADLEILVPLFNKPHSHRLASPDVAYPRRADTVWKWIKQQRAGGEGYFGFAIRLKAGDRLVGDCSLKYLHRYYRHADVGIGIAQPEDRNQGYGSDALRTLLRFGFMELDLYRIGLDTNSYNLSAIAAYKKVGFVEEGRIRETVWRDDRYYDTVVMSILQPEWMEANRA